MWLIKAQWDQYLKVISELRILQIITFTSTSATASTFACTPLKQAHWEDKAKWTWSLEIQALFDVVLQHNWFGYEKAKTDRDDVLAGLEKGRRQILFYFKTFS
jgi:hypothetical protein